MFFIAVYYILISKISGNRDIVIGTDLVGRTDPSLINIVGTFTNQLPLRMYVDPELTFLGFLNTVKECVLEAFDNQDYQNGKMMLQPSELTAKQIFIQTHFSFPNYLYESGSPVEEIFQHFDTEKDLVTSFELKLEVLDRNEKFYIGFIFNKLLFDTETADLFGQYYQNILAIVLKDNLLPINQIDVDELIS
jgi:non-ribosomal peptide synthetase component F